MIPLENLALLFSVLLIVGTGLTVPLFHFNYHKFIHSSLFAKIMFWVPIFLIFIGILYASAVVRIAVLVVLLMAALLEIISIVRKANHTVLISLYFSLFVFAMLHFLFIGKYYSKEFINLLITLCFASVLSDVAAFFFGSYLGVHKLPVWLNKNKSWEGVFGQLCGALAGVILVNTFVTPVISVWLFLPLGIGSALGDLANSYTKRKANIKDWSKAIPGHGGFIDQLSSLAGSALLTFYFLAIAGIA